ncbi:MAG: curli assembly protein CsgF [Candidimonas sp.]|jgi:curli production assembly/transport component CsgF
MKPTKSANYIHKPLLLAAMMLAAASQANATELVYYPLNPSFGGSPLNGQVLLNSALATNRHTDPDIDDDRYGIEQQSPLQSFNDMLERSILSRLASEASANIVDPTGQFKPGRLETGNFTIDVADLGGGTLTVTTIDKLTGGMTTFQVGK